MSGLIFIFVIGFHAAFAIHGIKQLRQEIKAATDIKKVIKIGVAVIVAFNLSLVCWFFLVRAIHLDTNLTGLNLMTSIGYGIPFFSFVATYFAIPKTLGRFSEFASRTSQGGIGLALIASTIFALIYINDFVVALRQAG